MIMFFLLEDRNRLYDSGCGYLLGEFSPDKLQYTENRYGGRLGIAECDVGLQKE